MGIIDKVKDFINDITDEGGDKGKDTYYSSKRELDNEEQAEQAFILAKEKLFHVNSWSKIPAIANSTFSLYDTNGFPITNKKPVVGDFIKIILPGPLPENWVKVIDIKEEPDMAEFTVKPSQDPTTLVDKTQVEHFFDHNATSTFKVERIGNALVAAEIGKDEAINNEGKEAGDRKVVNTLIASGGWAGFQKYQWKNLTDYLVGVNE